MSVTRLSTSWLGYDLDTNDLWFWDGARFRPLVEAAGYATTDALASVQAAMQTQIDGKLSVSPELLGINTTADATNRLALKSDAALFSHDDVTPGTGDMRIAVNKSAAGKDAAFVFENAFSPRALFGLLGDDNVTFKVSADGSTFKTGFTIDRSTGQVDLAQGAKFGAYINFDQYVGADAWTKIGVNNARHNDFSAFDAGANRFVAPAAGYYLVGAKYRFKANAAVPTAIKIGFGKNGVAPAAGDDECAQQGAIVSLVSSVQHMQLYKLAANDTIDVRAFMATNDGYCESGSVAFWGARIA